MKLEQAYRHLKELAEKMDVDVSEQSFKNTGIRVRSGFCKVKGKARCIIDKRLKLAKKVEILAECLAQQPNENIFIMPAVRELLERYRPLKIEDNLNQQQAGENDSGEPPSEEIDKS